MIGFLLSLIGGPSGAIAMGVKKFGGLLAAAGRWLMSPLWHVLIVVAVLSSGWGLWQGHRLNAEKSARAADNAKWSAAFRKEQDAFRISQGNVAILLPAIRKQTASINALGTDGRKRMAAVDKALAAQESTNARREAAARAIEASKPGGDCKTPSSVMNARGDL